MTPAVKKQRSPDPAPIMENATTNGSAGGAWHHGQSVARGQPEAHLPIIDEAHLDEQTFGDIHLRRDVLSLFLQQVLSTRAALETCKDPDERARLCHLIKGAARGVGAFELASASQLAEEAPSDGSSISKLFESLDTAAAHVPGLLRI
ncbi:MAG: histidine kinase [Pseudomonadota bacterium]